jgi:beta-lactamase class A
MDKLRVIMIIESIIIVGLIIFFLHNYNTQSNLSNSQQSAYCDKHFYDNQVCLLSPTIHVGTSFLILNFEPLKEDMQNYLSYNNLNSSVSIYILNIRDGASFGINSQQSFEPASLNKLPIAIIILKKVESGKLSLDTLLPIRDQDRDSGSGNLYAANLTEMSIKDLLHYMLSESDNTAFKVLERQVTIDDLNNLSSYLDYYTKNINYSVINDPYQVTPKSTANIFLSLYFSTNLKPEDSELILSDLANTTNEEFYLNKYAGLPSNVIVADKYGEYYVGDKKFLHDCGILYIGDSRILYCIMTKDLGQEQASLVIGDMVNKIYNYVAEQKKINNIP